MDPDVEDVDRTALHAAIQALSDHETRSARDMETYLGAILASQSHREISGPLRDASGASGVVVRRGRVVGQWGDPGAVEMSFSVTKTYLGAVAGLAFDRGLLPHVDEPVAETVHHEAFAGEPHQRITWRHLLQQSSEWGGTLWGRPYWSDPQGKQTKEVPLGEPGSVWAYNDVRINLLALALTWLWRRPLDDVLRSELMNRIGCSSTWSWHGYRDSVVEIDGHELGVVSGGAHWGGGLWANAWDHARFGYLYLRRGQWREAQVLSREWIDRSLLPCALNDSYGYLLWLNQKGRVFPQAPRNGFCARGNLGRQLVWVDPARALVVVSRWVDNVGDFLATVSNAAH